MTKICLFVVIKTDNVFYKLSKEFDLALDHNYIIYISRTDGVAPIDLASPIAPILSS